MPLTPRQTRALGILKLKHAHRYLTDAYMYLSDAGMNASAQMVRDEAATVAAMIAITSGQIVDETRELVLLSKDATPTGDAQQEG